MLSGKMTRGSAHYDKQCRNKLMKESSSEVQRDEKQEVSMVVSDIVDYVVRKEEFDKLDIPYDPEVPTSMKQSSSGARCNESCSRGCVCRNLGKKVVRKHCRKEDCIFHCICDKRLFYSLRSLPHRKTLKITLSNKTSDHSKEGDNANSGKMSRIETKSSKKDNRRTIAKPIGDSTKADRVADQDEASVPLIEISDDESFENGNGMGAEKRLISSSIFSDHGYLNDKDRRKLGKISERKDLLGFPDLFVWCPLHRRYSCLCRARILDMRTNILLWKPTGKVVPEILSSHNVFKTELHCARTFGSTFDYRLRNNHQVFRMKRLAEIENSVLSNSNSFVKVDIAPPLAIEDPQRHKTLSIKENGHCAEDVEEFSLADSSLELRVENDPGVFNSTLSTEDDSNLPEFGLVCLGKGFGYLAVKVCTSSKLVFQYPVNRNTYIHTEDIEQANEWLNRFFKGSIPFESSDTILKWILVEKKFLKNSEPFNYDLIKDSSNFVNQHGDLVKRS